MIPTTVWFGNNTPRDLARDLALSYNRLLVAIAIVLVHAGSLRLFLYIQIYICYPKHWCDLINDLIN